MSHPSYIRRAFSTALAFRSFSHSSNLTVTVTAKPKRRTSDDSGRAPCPSDVDTRASATSPKLKYRRPNDALGSYRAVSPASQPSLKPHLPLPDEEDDAAYSSRRSHARLSGHAQRPGLVSPSSPTAAKRLGDLQPRPDREDARPGVRMPSSQPPSTAITTFRKPAASVRGTDAHKWNEWGGGGGTEQPADASAALRRVEAERQKVRDQMEAQRADRYNMQRELEEVRRENRRLAARLNEALKSPLNARNDEAWGCSMYDIEIDGH